MMAQSIRDELIEEPHQGYSSPQDLLGEEGLFKELKKRLLERALGAELSEHLGYEKGDPAGRGGGNSRNRYSSKTVMGDALGNPVVGCICAVTDENHAHVRYTRRPDWS